MGLFVCLHICLCQSVCMSVCLSACIGLTDIQSVYLPACLSDFHGLALHMLFSAIVEL